MDPYLESHWGDVQQRLCTYCCDHLQEQLGGSLIARLGERLVVESLLDKPRTIYEPDSARLVTVVEFLSPSNKWPGDGREQYQRKQRELYNANVNLVEIDLIRSGPRVLMLPAIQFPPGLKPTYAARVYRATHRLRCELYPISLREPMRAIRVPLRKDDSDILLNLQPLVDMAYRNGRYDRTDYTQPCIPPLEGEDEQWAQMLLKNAGK